MEIYKHCIVRKSTKRPGCLFGTYDDFEYAEERSEIDEDELETLFVKLISARAYVRKVKRINYFCILIDTMDLKALSFESEVMRDSFYSRLIEKPWVQI